MVCGCPSRAGGLTELEAANIRPIWMRWLELTVGRTIPVVPGVTPGSGPAHLALFGYDPVDHAIGRGVLEAFGVGLPVGPHDVAARGNFVTVDAQGNISDRRAGRISTAAGSPLVAKLQQVQIPGRPIQG